MSDYELTDAQRNCLATLLEDKFLDETSSLRGRDHPWLQPNVIGRLLDAGLIDSRVTHKPGAGRIRRYTLTKAGRYIAQKCRQ